MQTGVTWLKGNCDSRKSTKVEILVQIETCYEYKWQQRSMFTY